MSILRRERRTSWPGSYDLGRTSTLQYCRRGSPASRPPQITARLPKRAQRFAAALEIGTRVPGRARPWRCVTAIARASAASAGGVVGEPEHDADHVRDLRLVGAARADDGALHARRRVLERRRGPRARATRSPTPRACAELRRRLRRPSRRRATRCSPRAARTSRRPRRARPRSRRAARRAAPR